MATSHTPLELLVAWVRRQVPPEPWEWFEGRRAALAGDASERDLLIALGFVPRRLGKADLVLEADDLAAADAARPGWDPRGWSVDEAARLALLLASFDGDEAVFAARIDSLCQTADIGELVTFYRGLPLYPGQDRLVARAREGVRSGMRPVFEAVAHRNPYPRERFDEAAWSQMVVKALFVGSTLAPIQGLDERRNPELARMLIDFAHERWAAGRPVAPELWRCVGRFADPAMIGDLARVLRTGAEAERTAAALALADCPRPEARAALAEAPELEQAVREGRLNWSTVATAA
jgi:hypothetical protein